MKALENKELSDKEYIYTLEKLLNHVKEGKGLVGLCEEVGNIALIDEINSHPINRDQLKARDTKYQPCPLDLRLHNPSEKPVKSYHGCFYHCGYKELSKLSKEEQIEFIEKIIKDYKKLRMENEE